MQNNYSGFRASIKSNRNKSCVNLSLWISFQNLGKAFMLSGCITICTGMSFGIGSALTTPQLVQLLPWLKNPLINFIASYITTIGAFGFQNLSALFTSQFQLH